ncbi:MAG TPA: hypothetical protein ENK18_22075 [Deltaproteobacteria bacterium]|nr:hypothetical protein [Deltaproteobacteria bacterium]
MLALLLLLCTTPASALSSRQAGPALDLAAGLGLSGAPVRAALGGQLSAGWWFGTYDDAYALGRYWWIGPTGRVDLHGERIAIASMLEIRRGLDVIVAGLNLFVAGGVVSTLAEPAPPLGYTGRAGLMARYRFHRYWGLTLRLEGGADLIDARISPAIGILLGVAFARPSKQHDPEI